MDLSVSPGTHTNLQTRTNGRKLLGRCWILARMIRRRTGSFAWIPTVSEACIRAKSDSRLVPSKGRIPVIVDNTKATPFPVFETSAELLYLLREYDTEDAFGFKDELERSQCLQWLFFWHGGVSVSSTCPNGWNKNRNRLLTARQPRVDLFKARWLSSENSRRRKMNVRRYQTLVVIRVRLT